MSDDPIKAATVVFRQHGRIIDEDSFRKNVMESLSQKLSQIFRNFFKVSCFSEKNDSPLMWSHYADSHRGFCIKYNFSRDEDIIKSLYPVSYSTKRLILSPNDLNNQGRLISALLCKSDEWNYENEWRYVVAINQPFAKMNHESCPPLSLYPNTIEAIYLGAEAMKHNSDSIEELKRISSALGIQLYEMEFADEEYRLVSHQII